MKKLILPAIAACAVLLGSCSTMQVAQQSTDNDDVYNAQGKAREVDYPVASEKRYRTEEQLYGGNDYATSDTDYSANSYNTDEYNDYDYDYGYASRIDRFQYASPWRNYYNDWYTYSYNPWYGYGYDPFFYNQGLFRPGYSMWFGTGLFGGGFGLGFGYNSWGYGYPYYGGYWGPTSYYGGGYGGYGYGYGYGGYGYGGVIANRNNKPRPYVGSGNPATRAGADRNTRPNVSYGNDGRVSGIYRRPTRNVSQGTTVDGRPSSGATSNTPTRSVRRPSSTEQSQPTRVERTERAPAQRAEPTYTPSTRSSSPSSGGGYSGGGGGGGGSSRPTRGGR